MPVERAKLEQLATAYVESMTSIRGRRVHRLLMREFAGSESVLHAVAEKGASALLAIYAGGAWAICQTDGTGAQAPIISLARSSGTVVTTRYDLHKDSLPIVAWSLWHPILAETSGTLTAWAQGLDPGDIARVAELLR